MTEGTARVEEVLRDLYGIRPETVLRPEERKKVPALVGLVHRLKKLGGDPLVVDAAAGRAPAGLVAARLLGWSRLVVIERDEERARSAQRAAASLADTQVDVRVGAVEDLALWPGRPEVVLALHACGPASDAVVDVALALRPEHLFLVPCCTAHSVRASPGAMALAEHLGVPTQPAVRRRFVQAIVDTERTLRLEAGGYQVSVGPLVPSTVTPHNLVWQARHVGSLRRQQRAQERLNQLFQDLPSHRSPTATTARVQADPEGYQSLLSKMNARPSS